MKAENWQNGQIVQINDLARAQTTKEDAVRERKIDAFSKGVVAGKLNTFSIGKSGTYNDRISISTGVAYDGYGERIVVSSASDSYNSANPTATSPDGLGGQTLTPQSSGCMDVTMSGAPTPHNYIFIKYLKTTDVNVISATDMPSQLIYVKNDDGYSIVVKSASASQSDVYALVAGEDAEKHVYLGYVYLPVSGIIEPANIDTSAKTYSRLGNDNIGTTVPLTGSTALAYLRGAFVTYEHHSQCLGTGLVSKTNPHGLTIDDLGTTDTRILEHEKNLHAKGIIGNQFDTESSLYGKGVFKLAQTEIDDILIEGFDTDQLAVSGGHTVTTDNIQSYQYVVKFREGDELLSDGQYVIYLNCVTKKIELAVKIGAASTEKYTLEVIDNATPGHPIVGTPIIEEVHAAADAVAAGSIPLHETSFFQTRQSGSTVPDAPATLSNFTYLTDLRMFGTVGTAQLSRDSLSDTVVIDHHLRIAPVAGLPEYADNAGAVLAGAPVGTLYRTGDILKIVHS